MADCESELFRDESRGLEGGAFFLATLLNRKRAKTSKGKNAIDSLKDFYLLKSDARFCQYFLQKFGFDSSKDNTPDLMKTASAEEKIKFLHDLVADCLRDLLPYFKESKTSAETVTKLRDHPLQNGRKYSRDVTTPSAPLPPISVSETLDMPSIFSHEAAEATASEVTNLTKENILEQFLDKSTLSLSSTRTKHLYTCKICSYESRYETICLTHIENCLENFKTSTTDEAIEANETLSSSPKQKDDDKQPDDLEKEDMFFNYKNGEFFLNAIFSITTVFERFGDGVGCFIISKILLPIFQGLNHSNYSCSIHRFISRVLCEASPREALKLIHERFSNKAGKPGKNVFRDRRMEFRIGITKKLIENLGPNFSDESVKQVNHSVDVKEDLYIQTRLSHGVSIRSGRHVPRSDELDFSSLVQNLTETEAHLKIEGRRFGNFEFLENLMDDKRFDRAKYYRWIAKKNEEAKVVIEAKNVHL